MERRVAVMGCGHRVKNLVRNFARLGPLSTVCRLSGEGRRVAVIATPVEMHHGLIGRALLTRKDVSRGKALALSYERGLHLTGLADRVGRILVVGQVL